MRLYIQDKVNLIKYNLPKNVDGSFLFNIHSSENDLDYSINVDAEDGKWVLKDNANVCVNVSVSGNLNESSNGTILKNYQCIPLSVVGISSLVFLYCLPSMFTDNCNYTIDSDTTTIGSDNSNNIVYDKNGMPKKCAVIKFDSNKNAWIMPVDDSSNKYIYVNSLRVLGPTRLFIGDVIFISGLRLIWMGNFIKITISSELFKVNGLSVFGELTIDNRSFTPPTEYESSLPLYTNDQYFSHMPRIRDQIEKTTIKIDSPPGSYVNDSELPFLLSIGSSFTMLGFSGITAFNMIYNYSEGNADFIAILPQIITLSMTLLGSLLFPLLVKRWNKSLNAKKEIKRVKKYKNYLSRKSEEIEEAINAQETILRNNYYSFDNLLNVVVNRSRSLWNRLISDDDFLELRIGVGDRPAFVDIEAAEEGFSMDDDVLLKSVYGIREKYKNLHDVPITLNFKDNLVVAYVLFNKKANDFLNWTIFQALTYHSPLELKIVVITNEENSSRWDYLKYCPHCWSDDKTIRYFANNSEDIKSLFQELDGVLKDRIETKNEKDKEAKELSKEVLVESELYESFYFIITDDFKSIRDLSFTNNVLKSEYSYGFSFLVVDKDLKSMPKECKKFVLVDDNDSVSFSGTINSDDTIHFKADYLSNVNMRELTYLINNIPVKGKDVESQLPTSLSFLQMYGVGKLEQLNIRNRWTTSDPINTLCAPIGVHTNGDLFNLNLHEKFDGPHGLIAGSTGSGKSEFIITYILSMALNYDPKEVQFVLIDYKGGGLAGAFENRESGVVLPHLVGTITNLDTAEMNRTLVSIRSELQRRQSKFNEYKDKTGESTMDIYKYQRLYREGLIDEPISHLFIISDEFAELKAQQPDFMDQLVSTARIGRSLGVHLILATQKPSGVVNDQIWSNSRFKVCLKVQSRADSMEMLKRPEAASIKEAGRFYLQVGYDEFFDIGQSAWTGEKYVPVERVVKKQDEFINFVNTIGYSIRNIMDVSKKEVVTEDYGDQLTNAVKYLYDISVKDGFKPSKLWLPALERTIILDNLLSKYKKDLSKDGLTVFVGEYDSPATQEQGLLKFNLLDGNVLIYGLPSSGKENLLSTIIHCISIYYKPEEVNFYIGDFGAETLKIFSSYPHVGDVFTVDESQKLTNMIKMLTKELDRRKDVYSEYGGNYIDYCKLSGKKDEIIVVVLNNYEVFTETYSRLFDAFVSLFRDGNKYGIVFVVSTTVTNAIRSRETQSFSTKICLKMGNENDYRDILGAPRKMVPADNFGRGIYNIGEGAYEFQTADICNRDVRTAYIKKVASILKDKFPKYKAKKIPILPEVAYVDDYLFELKGLDCVPIGVERNTLEVYVYNFLEFKINLISAVSIKSHVYFLYALIKQMISLDNVKVHIIDLLSIYRGNYKNVDLVTDNFQEAFVKMYENVENDKNLKEKHVYYVIGAAEFKNKVNGKYKEHVEKLFKNVQKCKNNTILLIDDTNSFKQLQVENWFIDNINNTFGIWLGEGIDIQTTLGVMSLSMEDKKILFPGIGYPVYQGNHMIIKYVVDGVDRKDE